MERIGGMASTMPRLLVARDLIFAWTGRTVRVRYQQSLMGWLWAVIQPAASAAMFTVVFTLFMRVDTGETPYVLFSYLGMLIWTLCASALPDMADSLVQNMSLVTKIYFPREALPVSAMLARLLDFGVGAALLILLLVYYQMFPSPLLWLYLPVILLVQIALVVGLGLIAAALNVFYRDVQPLLRLTLQLWFYASPIVYPVALVPERLQPFYYLNPMVGVIEAYRAVFLYGTTVAPYLALPAIIAFGLLLGGYWLFKRVEFQFADTI